MAKGIPLGNRGMTFESLIEFANGVYKRNGVAVIEKQHTKFIPIRNSTGQIVNCKVEEKATVDFMGRFGNTPIAFEAKHCAENVIAIKRVEEHQRLFLNNWTADGNGIGFVLVSFQFSDVYLIPWDCWQIAVTAREHKQKGTPLLGNYYCKEHALRGNSGQKLISNDAFQLTGKASIRKDELPNEWRVKQGGTVGLDFLERVTALWGGHANDNAR